VSALLHAHGSNNQGDIVLNLQNQLNIGNARFKVFAAAVLVALPLFYAAGQTEGGTPPDSAKPTESAKPGSANAFANQLPEGQGKEVVLKKCVSCHTLQNVIARRGNEDDWAQEVSKMVGRGANISDDDADTIVDYLAAHFGPDSPKPGTSSPSAGASQPDSSAAPDHKNVGAGTPIYINKATAGQLQLGLDLTQDQAEEIVHYREQSGDFKSLQQLLSVLGDDAASKIKDEQSKIEF
jgi:DNA uptake protein ComE-like DNA-binding protein